MKHFTTQEWIDFMNRAIPDEQRSSMQQHLQGGCERCSKELQYWKKVRGVAEKDEFFQPPSESLRWAKAAFASAGAIAPKTESLIEVLFDSFSQPAIAGARAIANASRQMLYRAGSYQIDIQIERKPGTNLLAIAGQVMDAGNPETPGPAVSVTLSNLHGHVIYTLTNEFGEFRGEIQNSGDLELSIPRPGQIAITISLRNALNELHGDKA